MQESTHYTLNTNGYKFAYSEPGSFSYHDYCDAYEINDQTYGNNGFTRQLENVSTMADERNSAVHMQQDAQSSSIPHSDHAECEY